MNRQRISGDIWETMKKSQDRSLELGNTAAKILEIMLYGWKGTFQGPLREKYQ